MTERRFVFKTENPHNPTSFDIEFVVKPSWPENYREVTTRVDGEWMGARHIHDDEPDIIEFLKNLGAAEVVNGDQQVGAVERLDCRLTRLRPETNEHLHGAVHTIRHLRKAIREHEEHIEAFREMIGDRGLKLIDDCAAVTIGQQADVLDALAWHGGMTFQDWEAAIASAERRREESTETLDE